jgi:predicted AlkP superfamily phosphohydrolase/phosphomutase
MGTVPTHEGVRGSTSPLVVVGWDAACWDLLTPWVETGKLPHLKKLMERGSYGPMESTPLPVSPAAWSSILTGQNPGKHGVFDWFARRDDSYAVEYVHTGQIKSRPMWEYVNQAGKRVGIFNVPMLYPAVSVDGFMLSGLAAPDASSADFAHPSDLLSELEHAVGPYWHTETEVYQRGREQEYLDNMLDLLAYQKDVLSYLIEKHPCEVYLFVFMQSDHAQHKFWRTLEPEHPDYDPTTDAQFGDLILTVYQQMDQVLGELIEKVGPDANFVLLSDHGGGPVYGIMYINRWLQEIGMLHLRSDVTTRLKLWLAKTDLIGRAYRLVAGLGLGNVANLVSKSARNKVLNAFLSLDDIDWSRTKAYSRGAFGQIYINLKGREPEGIVEPGEAYQVVVAALIAALKELKHPKTGEKLITDIHHKSERYQGPYLDQAADIIFSIQDYLYQASVKMGLDQDSILGKSEYEDSGSHRPEGILIMAGPGIQPGETITGAQVTDILPTLLALAGIPVPSNLDGKPLLQVFTSDQQKKVDFVQTASKKIQENITTDLDADELQVLEERLQDLGYLG